MKNLLIALFIFLSTGVFAQEKIKLDLSDANVLKLATEVYNNESQYQTKELLDTYKKFLSRIEIIKVSDEYLQSGNYKLLSTLELMDKYNTELDYDKGADFDITKLNPLKYFWVTKKDGSSDYYGIYQTNYLIRLLPE